MAVAERELINEIDLIADQTLSPDVRAAVRDLSNGSDTALCGTRIIAVIDASLKVHERYPGLSGERLERALRPHYDRIKAEFGDEAWGLAVDLVSTFCDAVMGADWRDDLGDALDVA